MNTSIFESSLSFKDFIAKTMSTMALGLAISTITAYFISLNLYTIVMSLGVIGAYLPIVLIFAELGLVIYFSSNFRNLSKKAAYICFIVYSLLNGFTLSVIFVAYTQTSIVLALGLTTILFICMSAIGHTTNVDLSKFSNIFRIALISLIVISIINYFIGSSFMDWALSCLGVLIFLGLIAFDTQKLRYLYSESFNDTELSEKLVIFGALELYLDFINLFLRILQIFGRRRD